jgi:hypothetical protein
MVHLEGLTHSADLNWDSEGKPVLYVVARGQAKAPQNAIDMIGKAVQMINESNFKHVCAVYDMLDVTSFPMLARFVTSGRIPSTERTAHIILGTHNAGLQLIGSLLAVTNGKRLRTLEVCKSKEEIAEAVKMWLSLPDNTREYTINNI